MDGSDATSCAAAEGWCVMSRQHEKNNRRHFLTRTYGTDISGGFAVMSAMRRVLWRQDTSPGTGEIRTNEVGDPLAKPAPEED